MLVCADAWYSEHAKKMQKKGAQIIIDIAAWPPTEVCGNPLGAWENVPLLQDYQCWFAIKPEKLNGWI